MSNKIPKPDWLYNIRVSDITTDFLRANDIELGQPRERKSGRIIQNDNLRGVCRKEKHVK